MSPSWNRLIRFEAAEGGIHYGEPLESSLSSDGSIDLTRSIQAKEVTGGPFDGKVGEKVFMVKKLLCPLESTPIIPCIGLNYKLHAAEAGVKLPDNPILFHKYPTALAGPGHLTLPFTVSDDQLDWEAELAVVIGKGGKNITKDKALDHVLGYTCGNDLSARKWQFACGGQWNFGKGMDAMAPIGPQIVSTSVITDPGTMRIRTILNGQTMQDSNTNDLIFDVKTIVSFLSQGTTILPGTVILTGTPAGVGFARKPPLWLKEGDVCEIVMDRIGVLRNTIGFEKKAEYVASM